MSKYGIRAGKVEKRFNLIILYMHVPFVDLHAQYLSIKDEIDNDNEDFKIKLKKIETIKEENEDFFKEIKNKNY